MLLLSEMLEELFEMKLVSKEADTLDGNFIYCETIANEYTPKAMRIKSQKRVIQIKNLDEKIIQETSFDTLFKTDSKGTIVEQQMVTDSGVDKFPSPVINYDAKYDDKKRLIIHTANIVKTDTKSDETMHVTERTAYSYDENGRIKMIINDCIPAEKKKFEVPDTNFMKLFNIEYDEAGMLSAVNVTNIDTLNKDYILERYVINYNADSYIDSIHRVGGDELEDEFYEYYTDGTVSVVKNTYDDNKVISKSSLTFKKVA